jgi:hypothetical protein
MSHTNAPAMPALALTSSSAFSVACNDPVMTDECNAIAASVAGSWGT